MVYLYGTATELVYRNDIKHMSYSRHDLLGRGWTNGLIDEYLGPPDFQVRQGRYNTGPVLYWKRARVEEIEASLNDGAVAMIPCSTEKPGRYGTWQPDDDYLYLYHVTTPEIAAAILREGFKDHATQVYLGIFLGTRTYKKGVWFADVPPIGAISVDCRDYMQHTDTDESWIRIKITQKEFDRCFLAHERNDGGWPTRQWLIRAREANKFPRDEMSLLDVLTYRMATDFDRIGLHLRDGFVREMIETEMTDATIKARWLDALDTACRLRQQTGG
jgi:hypothetical protein